MGMYLDTQAVSRGADALEAVSQSIGGLGIGGDYRPLSIYSAVSLSLIHI